MDSVNSKMVVYSIYLFKHADSESHLTSHLYYAGRVANGCRLLNPKNTLLPILAAQVAFEIAIGLNGRVWIKSPSISETIALKRVLEGVDDGSIGIDKAGLTAAVKAYMA